MSTELQSLIDKIQAEGIDKAKAEAGKVVAEANAKAKGIVAEEAAAAAVLRQRGEADAALFRERAERAVVQAARDVQLGIEKDINETLGRLLLGKVSGALSQELLGDLIVEVVTAYAGGARGQGLGASEGNASGGKYDEVTVSLPPAQVEALRATVLAALQGAAKAGVRIAPDADVRSGFRVSLAGGRIEHDFTAQAIQGALARLLRPSLAALIQKEP